MPLERAVLRLRARLPARRPGQPEPRGLRRVRALLQHPLEGREPPAHVVEDPVEQDPQPARVGGLDQAGEVPLVAEPGVDPVMVGGVVPVRLRGEDRPERDPRGAQVHRVVQPGGQLPEPVRDRRRLRRPASRPGSLLRLAGGLGGGEAERVDLPPDGVLHPVRHALLLPLGRSATLLRPPGTSGPTAAQSRTLASHDRRCTDRPGVPPARHGAHRPRVHRAARPPPAGRRADRGVRPRGRARGPARRRSGPAVAGLPPGRPRVRQPAPVRPGVLAEPGPGRLPGAAPRPARHRPVHPGVPAHAGPAGQPPGPGGLPEPLPGRLDRPRMRS